jgi:hypothetical protein
LFLEPVKSVVEVVRNKKVVYLEVICRDKIWRKARLPFSKEEDAKQFESLMISEEYANSNKDLRTAVLQIKAKIVKEKNVSRS